MVDCSRAVLAFERASGNGTKSLDYKNLMTKKLIQSSLLKTPFLSQAKLVKQPTLAVTTAHVMWSPLLFSGPFNQDFAMEIFM